MEELRVLVFSATFGAGHIRAAEALIEALREKSPNAEITHLDFLAFISKRFNTLAKNTYIKLIKHTPKLYGMFYYRTSKIRQDSLFQRFINIVGRKEFLDYIKKLNPDVIICTYPVIGVVLGELRNKGVLDCKVASVVTDYGVHSQYIHRGVDLYIVGCQDVYDGLRAEGIAPERIKITGIPVSPKFEQVLDREEVSQRLNLKPIRPTILVMGGAYGVLGGSKQICKLLLNSETSLQILVVCGRDEKLYRTLEGLEGHNPMVCYGYIKNVEELMSVADLIITKAGGLTVSESLTKKLPMIVFKPIPGQEAENAHFLERIGAAKLATTEEELEETITFLLSHPEEIENMRKAAANALPGHASERAVEHILAIL
ncbi:UDP-N-acetylglucosamine:LPS N-acetylglucosamine transferase [Desulfitobacterium dichloroeliminans LMG P-21439]|uniref:UDP-N-acetylglucosamine:LPS N-acetylglucosamine transferase n=1 Tax=Desulfitobacterium dichloroeliminans (strain LMG P-21439 / DCA1) TaxID=871963 RepID=L0FBV0_DESDL|nr:glycosyltransferase [Desulfitobacterium dichloroeliminans]AGA70490.1 UDP-N-acetylglucosamine:LPS N-acetylglucosamine transferase [Desulfitobacterium dichloroeliminans LMG P-21439]